MALSDGALKVLSLSFHKEISEISFYNFEKLMIFGVLQTLALYSDIELLDYAVPANRMMVPYDLAEPQRRSELHQLCQKFQADAVLYGQLEPEIGPGGYLDGIYIDLKLYNRSLQQHNLNLRYYFTQFENARPKASAFTPSWDGIQELFKWIASQIVGAIRPDQALPIWKRISKSSLAYGMSTYNQLATAYYLTNEDSLSQKISILTTLMQENPNLMVGHLESGALFKRLKNFEQAVSSFEWAFKLMKDATARQKAACATEIGVCYALSRDFDKACEWWKTAIIEDPTMLNPYMNLAHGLEEQGFYAEAEYYFKKVSEIAPDDQRVYFNLARLYTKLEIWDKAITQYEHQVLIEPNNGWIYSNIANCYLHKGDIMRAKDYLLKTLEIDPDGEAGRCAQFILSGLQAAEV